MKILIVDDSKAMRMIVVRTLRQCGITNLQLVEASNGKEALGVIDSQSPDLVLCDWNMPEMTGIELLGELRGKGNDIRFGFVTTECTSGVQEAAAELNAEFMITKPFSAKDFEAVLNADGTAAVKA